MFINIDYNKRPKKSKLHLAKPNKQIISHISEKFQDKLSLKLGNINELEFSIPHLILDDETGELVHNPHVDLIKEKMLIRITLEAYKEWYVVESIEEDGDNSDTFNVKAFSLGQELAGKRISGLVEDSINATDLLKLILDISPSAYIPKHKWTIGTIDPLFDTMFRSFESGDNSNALDCVLQLAETYGALIVWDTEARKISLKDMSTDGRFRGMSVDYGKFLNSIKRTRTTDEMVTRLHVYGNEDLSIHSVNPTGMPYIEDFSYFMYPFKRDVNKNVITSSAFMSDALCNAILDHQSLLVSNAPQIKALTDALALKNTELVTEESKLMDLENDLETILELLDTAKASLAIATPEDQGNAQALVNQRIAERDSKQIQVNTQQIIVTNLENEIKSINTQIDMLQDTISNQSNFTDALKDELSLYVIEKEWRDDRYINVQELYDDAVKKFDELRQPKVVIEASIDSLLNVIEEQYYWDKLVLGDLIKVKYPQMNIEYMSKIIEINYDLENGEADITIANTKDLLSETDKLVQLLYNNSSASTLIQNNKYKWDKVNAISNQVSSLLTSEWDATKNKIIAGVRNSVEVGNRGVIIRNPDFPDEVVIMQSGVVALSKDGGETWKTAIRPDGIVAERLIGQIIAGNELLITNSAGTFTFDNNGVVIDAESFILRTSNGGNLKDRWDASSDYIDDFKDDGVITAYEKKMLKIEWNKTLDKYNSNINKLSYYYTDGGDSLMWVTNYKTRYTELYNYLFVDLIGGSTKPILADDNMANSTRVDKNVFDSKFRTLSSAEITLDEQLALKAKDLADSASQLAKDAQDSIDEINIDAVYKIELTSSNGLLFKNGQINTVITAKLYKGTDDITATIPNSGFIWKKTDKNGVLDTAWNTAHVNVGKSITITQSDIYQKATFSCDIDIV